MGLQSNLLRFNIRSIGDPILYESKYWVATEERLHCRIHRSESSLDQETKPPRYRRRLPFTTRESAEEEEGAKERRSHDSHLASRTVLQNTVPDPLQGDRRNCTNRNLLRRFFLHRWALVTATLHILASTSFCMQQACSSSLRLMLGSLSIHNPWISQTRCTVRLVA